MATPRIKSSGNYLAIEIDESISDQHLQVIGRHITTAAASFGKIRLFIFLKHYPTLNSAEDLYDDLRFVKIHGGVIAKAAVMADKSWKRTWVGLFGLFSGVELEFFDLHQSSEAARWIQAS